MTPNQYKDALTRGYITEVVRISTPRHTPGDTGRVQYSVGVSVQQPTPSDSHHDILNRVHFVPTPPDAQEAHAAVEAALPLLKDKEDNMKHSDPGYDQMRWAVTNAERYLDATS